MAPLHRMGRFRKDRFSTERGERTLGLILAGVFALVAMVALAFLAYSGMTIGD